MKTLYLSLITLLLIACQSNKSVNEKIENDETFQVESSDQEMNKAIAKSQETFDEFVIAFKNPKKEDEAHAIKIGFATPDNSLEHIWVGNLLIKDGDFYGTVNNTPQSTQEVAFGDTIKVDKNKMSDWMYISNGILKGGYTLRVIRNQMNDVEKKQFDESVGFIIEE